MRTKVSRVKFSGNPDCISIFEDMIPAVGEVSRSLTSLSSSIRRNSRPHLYGPEGILETDEAGNAQLSIEGTFFPLGPDDEPPGYLQWDSKLEAVQFAATTHLGNALAMAGLATYLFDPSKRSGPVTGEALRRLLIPFFSRTDHYSHVNNRAIEDLVSLWNRNRSASKLEVFDFNAADITVTWHYEDQLRGDESVQTPDEGRGAGNSDGDTGE